MHPGTDKLTKMGLLEGWGRKGKSATIPSLDGFPKDAWEGLLSAGRIVVVSVGPAGDVAPLAWARAVSQRAPMGHVFAVGAWFGGVGATDDRWAEVVGASAWADLLTPVASGVFAGSGWLRRAGVRAGVLSVSGKPGAAELYSMLRSFEDILEDNAVICGDAAGLTEGVKAVLEGYGKVHRMVLSVHRTAPVWVLSAIPGKRVRKRELPSAPVSALVCLAHFYREKAASGGARYGSHGLTPKASRLASVSRCVGGLTGLFGRSAAMLHQSQGRAVPVYGSGAMDLQVALVMRRDANLWAEMGHLHAYLTPVITDAPPMEVGFAAHRFGGRNVSGFDWYGFMEDDLEIVDPLFFRKMEWFVKEAGSDAVLFPQRVEVGPVAGVARLFVDGSVRPQVTARFQDLGDRPVLMLRGMGSSFFFQRPSNPHCGAHFLKGEQLARWMKDADFGVAKSDFIGPLESAATLGVMKNFRIYKPGVENPDFLEVRHAGNAYFGMLGGRIPLAFGDERAVP